MKKTNDHISIIVILFLLMFGSSIVSTESYLVNKDIKYIILYSIINLIICCLALMLVPLIIRIKDKGKIEYKKGKKICLWNSIILFIVSVVLDMNYGFGFVGGIGAAFFFFINMWIFVDFGTEEENDKYACSECGALIDEDSEFCPNCGAKFEDKENIKESVSKPKNDKKLKKEDKKNVKKKKTLKFKCSECGALIDEDSEFCPNCGEKFEDDEIEIIDENNREENFDDKYDNLKKLKKLLDEGIITKEEFENEKKKILNEK